MGKDNGNSLIKWTKEEENFIASNYTEMDDHEM